MEQDQQDQDEGLYDFLYKDAGRISSLYAQKFSGNLLAVEETTTTRKASEGTGSIKIHGSGVDAKFTRDVVNGIKRSIDPHDFSTIAIIRELLASAKSPEESKPGQIVVAKGSLTFLENTIMGPVLTSLPIDSKHGAFAKNSMKKFFEKMTFPTLMILETNTGRIVGNIQPGGLRESIESFFFLYGSQGMSDVVVVGIREARGISFGAEAPGAIGMLPGLREIYKGLSDLVGAEDSTTITPLCLLRKLDM